MASRNSGSKSARTLNDTLMFRFLKPDREDEKGNLLFFEKNGGPIRRAVYLFGPGPNGNISYREWHGADEVPGQYIGFWNAAKTPVDYLVNRYFGTATTSGFKNNTLEPYPERFGKGKDNRYRVFVTLKPEHWANPRGTVIHHGRLRTGDEVTPEKGKLKVVLDTPVYTSQGVHNHNSGEMTITGSGVAVGFYVEDDNFDRFLKNLFIVVQIQSDAPQLNWMSHGFITDEANDWFMRWSEAEKMKQMKMAGRTRKRKQETYRELYAKKMRQRQPVPGFGNATTAMPVSTDEIVDGDTDPFAEEEGSMGTDEIVDGETDPFAEDEGGSSGTEFTSDIVVSDDDVDDEVTDPFAEDDIGTSGIEEDTVVITISDDDGRTLSVDVYKVGKE